MSCLKPIFSYSALVGSSILLWVNLSLSGLLDGFMEETLRWRYLYRGELPSAAPIVFVDVDPSAVAKIGDRPWDRLNFALAIEALLGPGQANAVAVDIIFSPLGTGSLLDVERARRGNLRFGKVVERYQDRLVLAAAYTGTAEDVSRLPMRRYEEFVRPEQVPFPEAPSFPIIKSADARLGLANVDEPLNRGQIPSIVVGVIDSEGEGFGRHLIMGQLRHFYDFLNQPRLITEEDSLRLIDADGFQPDPVPRQSRHRFFNIGFEVFLAAHGLSAADVEWSGDALIIRRGGEIFRQVPLVDGQSLMVNWVQDWDISDRDVHVSMAEVLEKADALGAAAASGSSEEIAALKRWFELFRGKVIFIGGVDATLKDLAPTPFTRVPQPKVGLHANVYRMLDGEYYIQPLDTFESSLLTAALAVSVAGLIIWSGRWRLFTRFGALCLALGYLGVAFFAFSAEGLILPIVAPMGSCLTAALAVVIFKLGTEERQRRRIKTLFGSYVSPSLVEEMVESQRDPELGGAEVTITALFSDVEGFSALSEELSPSELVALMNEYLGAMTETFHKERGTLDKYIGDAIVTMFGMPYPVEDHAARACRSAMRMQERHAELREQWAREGKWPERVLKMRTRIGINTGEAVIGNMGSHMRFNYTMMGDSVNLAARCESGAKSYGVYTMMTADTLRAAERSGEKLSCRKLDRIIVKGKSRPVEIYELWDGTIDPVRANKCRQFYEEALEQYFAGEWSAALSGFESCRDWEPARAYAPTTPSDQMAARCRKFLQNGAPENWDGVYRMQSK